MKHLIILVLIMLIVFIFSAFNVSSIPDDVAEEMFMRWNEHRKRVKKI